MEIDKQFFKDVFGWGFLLLLFGYVLGIMLFFIVPKIIIGWIITPLATIVAVWILIRKIQRVSLSYYFLIAIFWSSIAVILDYFLLVKIFKPEDGYYKPDVYLYYSLTFILPLAIGLWKRKKIQNTSGLSNKWFALFSVFSLI